VAQWQIFRVRLSCTQLFEAQSAFEEHVFPIERLFAAPASPMRAAATTAPSAPPASVLSTDRRDLPEPIMRASRSNWLESMPPSFIARFA
jgi:hypothetical protein